MSNKVNFWSDEEVTEETLRKREHKVLLELICQHIGNHKNETERNRKLDAAQMYMTIDLGSTPRAAIKQAIADRVAEIVNA